MSINWGPWTEGKAAVLSQHDQRRLAEQGLNAITPEQGTQALQALLNQDTPQAMVLSANWSLYQHHFPTGQLPPFLVDLVETDQPGESQPNREPELLQRLAETPPAKQRHLLLAYIREQASKVLGLEPTRPIDPQQPLNELGLDSLMAVELRNALSSSVQASLPATLLFDYPTLEALAGYLGSEVLALGLTQKPGAQPESTTQQGGSLAALENLSDEEAEALLLAELTDMKGN
jgi:acyl carrier protein